MRDVSGWETLRTDCVIAFILPFAYLGALP